MIPPPLPAASGTPRTRLARLALDAALAVDGVVAGDAGPRGMHVTGQPPHVLRGVRAVAEPDGRYAIDLGLRARITPLEPLAERVRERIAAEAGRAGLAARLGEISVMFHDVVDPDEAAAAALADALPPPDPAATA